MIEHGDTVKVRCAVVGVDGTTLRLAPTTPGGQQRNDFPIVLETGQIVEIEGRVTQIKSDEAGERFDFTPYLGNTETPGEKTWEVPTECAIVRVDDPEAVPA